MIDAASLNPNGASLHCICGGPGTGKTEALVRHAIKLVDQQGVPADDLLVFAATPDAASALKERLRANLNSRAENVQVETVRACALRILNAPSAREHTGRSPRVLAPFEVDILVEDAKTTGMRPKHLKRMMEFLCKGWTELADDDPGWIITLEEQLVSDALKESLALTQGMLECEVSNLAVNYLRANPAALRAAARPHVLVDDYQLLSPASQALTGMLAGAELWVSGDLYLRCKAFEPHPHADGLAVLSAAEGTNRIELAASHRSPASVAAANSLLAEELSGEVATTRVAKAGAFGVQEGFGNPELAVLPFDTPDDELEGVFAEVARLVEAGAEPGSIFVAAPNQARLEHLAGAFAHFGMAIDTGPACLPLLDGRRSCDHNRATAAAFTALSLTAQPESALAWRSWCGFGGDLASSALFSRLGERQGQTGEGLASLLEQLAADPGHLEGGPIYNLNQALDAYRLGKDIAHRCSPLRGRALLDALAGTVADGGAAFASVRAALLQLCAPVSACSTPQELYEHAVRRLTLPTYEGDPRTVKLGLYEHAIGLNPETVVLTGLVNGLTPSHSCLKSTALSPERRTQTRARDASRLYAAAGKAGKRLIVTHFREAPLEEASILDLKIERIRLREGKRICALSPSVFLKAIAPHAD